MFSLGGWRAHRGWITSRSAAGCGHHLYATCPLDGKLVNTAVTAFADDCTSTVSAESFECAYYLDRVDDHKCDLDHDIANMKQNYATWRQLVFRFRARKEGLVSL